MKSLKQFILEAKNNLKEGECDFGDFVNTLADSLDAKEGNHPSRNFWKYWERFNPTDGKGEDLDAEDLEVLYKKYWNQSVDVRQLELGHNEWEYALSEQDGEFEIRFTYDERLPIFPK